MKGDTIENKRYFLIIISDYKVLKKEKADLRQWRKGTSNELWYLQMWVSWRSGLKFKIKMQ